jgi:type II secretory pathway component PulC
VNGKSLYLISSENMAVLKEYNLAGHFEKQPSVSSLTRERLAALQVGMES